MREGKGVREPISPSLRSAVHTVSYVETAHLNVHAATKCSLDRCCRTVQYIAQAQQAITHALSHCECLQYSYSCLIPMMMQSECMNVNGPNGTLCFILAECAQWSSPFAASDLHTASERVHESRQDFYNLIHLDLVSSGRYLVECDSVFAGHEQHASNTHIAHTASQNARVHLNRADNAPNS